MTVRAARLQGKPRDHHIRPERADDPHHVRHHLAAIPDAQRFEIILGKTKINRPREKLAAAIQPPGGEQFLRAGHTQFLAKFRSQHILPAIPPRGREIGRAIIPPARQIGDQQRVFVIRMRRHIQHTAPFIETLELLENCRPGHGLNRAQRRNRGQSPQHQAPTSRKHPSSKPDSKV